VNSGKATKLVKGKVGKPKVKKMHLEETLPSPFGRRIEPQVTQAMKADASKKLTKKKKVWVCVCVCVCGKLKCDIFTLNINMSCIKYITGAGESLTINH